MWTCGSAEHPAGVWSAGLVGLYRAPGGSAAQQYDDVKIWLDNDANGTLDSGDAVQVADDFSSSTLSLAYDANGNLTGDGIFGYVYDAWNRLRKVQRVAAHSGQADDVTTTAAVPAVDTALAASRP